MLEKDIKKILISQDEITEAAKKLGAQLTKDYEGKNPILVGILKGSIPFMAELVKYIDTHLEMDFMRPARPAPRKWLRLPSFRSYCAPSHLGVLRGAARRQQGLFRPASR